MAFQVSPGVSVREFDFSTSVPQTATTSAAMVGDFSWGPVGQATTISTVDELKLVFGKPTESNYKPFFTASNFLNYAQSLKVVRSVGVNAVNAISGTLATDTDTLAVYSTDVSSELPFKNRSNTQDQYAKDWGNGGSYPLGELVGALVDAELTSTTPGTWQLNAHIPVDWLGNYSSSNVRDDIDDLITLKVNTATDSINLPFNHLSRGWIKQVTATSPFRTDFVFGGSLIDSTAGFITIPPTFVLDTSVGKPTLDVLLGFTSESGVSNNNNLQSAWSSLKAIVDLDTGYAGVMAAWLGDGSQTYKDFLKESFDYYYTTTAEKTGLFVGGFNLSTTSDANYLRIRSSDSQVADFRIPLTVTASGLVSTVKINHTGNILDDADGFIDSLPDGHNAGSYVVTTESDWQFNSSNTLKSEGGVTVTLEARNTFRLADGLTPNGTAIKVKVDGVEVNENAGYSIYPTVLGYSELYLGESITGTTPISLHVTGVPFSYIDSNPVQMLTEEQALSYSGGDGANGVFAARYPGEFGNRIKVTMLDSATYLNDPLGNSLSILPTDDNDIAVIIEVFKDDKQNVVENFEIFDNLTKSLVVPGTENRNFIDYINANSSYIYALQVPAGFKEAGAFPTNFVWKNDLITIDGVTKEVYMSLDSSNTSYVLSGGTTEAPTASELISSFDVISNPEQIEYSMILSGGYHLIGDLYTNVIRHSIELSNTRQDCVTIFSAPESVYATKDIDNVVAWYDTVGISTSYAVADSNYKRQYDVYNDKYRWVPFCGDMGGVFSRTDTDKDPWFSPAGFNRGTIKNVVKLYMDFTKMDRDKLYLKSINPIVSFPGQGTILYGDKTFMSRPSAFDRINVRRLFIVLEKIISKASVYTLFEFNDTFTRSQFVAMVEPFLTLVKSRQGVYDFSVICDETNNPPDVVDAGQFVGDIYIKPSRSINFIRLNFVAVRNGVEFSEVVGNR